MKKETSRKDLIRVATKWLKESSETSNANKSDLEIILMLMHDFKSLIRCDSCLQFTLKCLQMIQEDEDPCFSGLLVLPVTDKVD